MEPFGYNFFNSLIENKTILYIPIISCINRDTQEYNLSADGNVNRFITTFCECNDYKKLYIILPSIHIKGSESIIKKFKDIIGNIEIIWSNNFGIHAGEQRNKAEVVDSLYEEIKNIDYDICIFESQRLGFKFLVNQPEHIYIFWNPVSKTNEKTRIFLEGYDEINSFIISKVNYMIIASPDQVKFYNKYSSKLIYLDKLIDRFYPYFDYKIDYNILEEINKFNGKTIFYLPFRLTDEGYKFDKVLDYISKTKEDYIILYTDPNNSHVIDKLPNNDKFVKVSSNRNTYYTILDNVECIIPYFEDIEFINHAAIHEFMDERCKCKVILYKQNSNPYNVFDCKRISNYEG